MLPFRCSPKAVWYPSNVAVLRLLARETDEMLKWSVSCLFPMLAMGWHNVQLLLSQVEPKLLSMGGRDELAVSKATCATTWISCNHDMPQISSQI